MIARIRNSYFTKTVSMLLMVQLLLPIEALAITGGPSQPEFVSFTPVGASDMVDLFSGDFQYNIPLLDVDGYPVNLSYSSGIGMEDQASCVGLGWTLNAAGAINRSIRGIPDDFNGSDKITTTTNYNKDWTIGVNFSIGNPELLGKKFPITLRTGIFYNNYRGPGFESGIRASVSASGKVGASIDLGVSADNGFSVGLGASLADEKSKGLFGGSADIEYNSRAGLRSISVTPSATAALKSINKRAGTYTIPIGLETYTPQMVQPMRSFSVSGNLGFGVEAFWLTGEANIFGYYNEEVLANPVNVSPAYGYLYSGKGANDKYAMHDFNREKDGLYKKCIPALPMTQMTYDIYTVTGQGVSGMFRPHRDVGTVYDPYTYSNSSGNSFGADAAGGLYFKIGLNYENTHTASTSGKWSSDNGKIENLGFKNENFSDPAYEQVYFKGAGEFSIINKTYFENIQGVNPLRIQLEGNGKMGSNFFVRNNLSTLSESAVDIGDGLYKHTNRVKRNQLFSYLTAAEVQGSDSIYLYDNTKQIIKKQLSSIGEGRQPHHISEITVTKPDGSRYIYGSQTYNFKQEEVTFNATDLAKYPAEGLVGYSPNDASVKNNRGIDNYYNSNELPPYANAYQLTSILSSDYVDVTGNGTTPDDLGNYTKFSYLRVHGKDNPYRWRNPYDEKKANLQEGLRFKKIDDRGNFLYGEKEIKLLHSIETKNNIAIFYYSDRDDAYEVKGRDGGRGSTKTLQKLDSIRLYSRFDMTKPIKSVHFDYEYTLCQKLPSNINFDAQNTENGKLTLVKLWFTYGHSRKGTLSPYQFIYPDKNDKTGNPDYDPRAQDRWGQYKKNPSSVPYNIDEPYTDQGNITDIYAGVWNLRSIILPSGGKINIEYEADDYAYIQNRRAANMVKVIGFANNGNATQLTQLNNNLYDLSRKRGASFTDDISNNYVYIEAPKANSKEDFRKKYLGDIEKLFFRFYIKLTGNNNDYVSGYVNIKNAETGWVSDKKWGWIKLPLVTINDGNGGRINPITQEAMQYIFANSSDLYYGGNNQNDYKNPGEAVLRKLAGLIDDFIGKMKGPYHSMLSDNFCKQVDLNRSYLRLLTPDYHKKGGGSRVREITLDDNWQTMSGSSTENFSYGQTYKYELITEQDEGGIPKGTTISSGVATYEPLIGNEENPFRQPNPYTEKHKGALDYDLYQERPYGESFFPAPSVGYSRVTVTNRKKEGVDRSATGHTVNEFYTAKDFPVIIREPYKGVGGKGGPIHDKPSRISQLLRVDVVESMTVSQSYAIELNDMHGKPKAVKVYGEKQSVPISSVEYFYKMENSQQLSNQIPAIKISGQVENMLAGIDVDMVLDERENVKSTTGCSIDGNADISPAIFMIPFPIIVPWPGYYSEKLRFRSVTATKVITRHGILEKTVAQDLGSTITTTNLGWDAETGEVLLTRTQNSFGDYLYNFTYPAHWAYDGMGPAYRNTKLKGNYSLSKFKNELVEGDELYFPNGKAWVTKENNNIKLINSQGVNFTGTTGTATLLRSGRRNMQNTPIGTITTRTNPVVNNEINFSKAEVLNAGAVVFNAQWKENICETCKRETLGNNPYITGEAGNYRPEASYIYQTGRSQSDDNGNTNIRKDGFFDSFSPFWKNPNTGNSSFPWVASPAGWTFATEVTMFSPYGFEIENRDALGRYTAATYGYNNTLPTAISANSRYKEMGFTGFEDVDECTTHFGFDYGEYVNSFSITTDQSHTGRYSIKVKTGKKVGMEKTLRECIDRGIK